MNVNLQDQRYGLHNLEVTIDGKEIDITHIVDLTIDFDMYNPYISANLILKVPNDTLEKYKFEGNSKVQILAKDSQGTEFDNTFIAYTSDTIRTAPDEYRITFLLIDEFSFKASRLFVSKGFEKASITDILDSDKMLKPLYDEFNSKKRNFENSDFKLDTFAIPSSKSALSVQNYIKEYFNVLVYQTRTEYKIQKWETLMSREVLKHGGKEVVFKYPCDVFTYIFAIDDFKAKQTNTLESSSFAPDLQIYSYDPKKRNKKFFSYDIKKTVKDMGSDLDVPKVSEGIKFAYQSMVNPENQIKTQYQRNIYGTSTYEMICKGNFIINPGDLVMLSYEGNEKTSSKTLSGKYIVTRVTDKIIQGAFSQRIVIARPNVDDAQEEQTTENTGFEPQSVENTGVSTGNGNGLFEKSNINSITNIPSTSNLLSINPSSIKNAVKNIVTSDLKNLAKKSLSNIPLDSLPISSSSIANVANNVIQGGINGNFDLKQAFSPVISEVKGAVTGKVLSVANDTIGKAVSSVTSNLKIDNGLVNKLTETLGSKVLNTTTNLSSAFINNLGDVDVSNVLKSTVNSVKNTAKNLAFNEIKSVVKDTATNILTPISDSTINTTRNTLKMYENIVPEKNDDFRAKISPFVNQVKDITTNIALSKIRDSFF